MKLRGLIQGKDVSKLARSSRLFIGIYVSSNFRKLEAAIINAPSVKEETSVVLHKSLAFDLPIEISKTRDEIIQRLSYERNYTRNSSNEDESSSKNECANDERGSRLPALEKYAELRVMLAAVSEEAIDELLTGTELKKDDVVAVSVNAPAFHLESKQLRGTETILSTVDALRLSESTGLNVIDGFATSEFSCGNRELFLYPYWILLGDASRDKLVIDLGDTARLYFLPRYNPLSDESKGKLRYEDVVLCGRLLDGLTKSATKGEAEIDVGGRLSVQGRCVKELLDLWREGGNEGSSSNANGVSAASKKDALNESYYLSKLLSAETKVSTLDALCTAVHWIVEQIQTTVQKYERDGCGSSYDVLLLGGGRYNGLLYSKLSSIFASRRINVIDNFFSEDSFDAVANAVLGVLRVQGVPAYWYDGTDLKKRVCGRIVPGDFEAYKRLQHFSSLSDDFE